MKSTLILCTLIVSLSVGAVQVAVSRYNIRQLMSNIQALKSERDSMRIEWSKLVLEESMLTDEAIIYQVAERNLKMTLPKSQVVVYRQK